MTVVSVQVVQVAPSTSDAVRQRTRDSYCTDDIVLQHLKTPAEIASVFHLREEIDLSIHAASGPAFAELEKKETSTDLCLHFT